MTSPPPTYDVAIAKTWQVSFRPFHFFPGSDDGFCDSLISRVDQGGLDRSIAVGVAQSEGIQPLVKRNRRSEQWRQIATVAAFKSDPNINSVIVISSRDANYRRSRDSFGGENPLFAFRRAIERGFRRIDNQIKREKIWSHVAMHRAVTFQELLRV